MRKRTFPERKKRLITYQSVDVTSKLRKFFPFCREQVQKHCLKLQLFFLSNRSTGNNHMRQNRFIDMMNKKQKLFSVIPDILIKILTQSCLQNIDSKYKNPYHDVR